MQHPILISVFASVTKLSSDSLNGFSGPEVAFHFYTIFTDPHVPFRFLDADSLLIPAYADYLSVSI